MGRSYTVGRTKTNGGIAEKHRKNKTDSLYYSSDKINYVT